MSKLTSDYAKHIFVKALIVLFYLSLIAIFLYAPRIYNLFVTQDNVITVYAPRETFPVEKFGEFKAKTGISVNIAYYDTNEELFAKLKISKGVGYDLVVPSDYMVEYLIQAGLVQRLDLSKISNFSSIDPLLLNKFYDPGNQYSLPVSWIPYGIGFDKRVVQLPDDVSWEVVFNPEALKKLCGDCKISMLNDAREAIFLTAIYLFGQTDAITPAHLEKITSTLIQQKPIVESYTEAGAKHLLLSQIVPMAVLPAARLKEMEDPEKYGFVIPREGSLVDIMNVAIPVASQNAEAVHKLIDFLLSREIGAYNFEELDCNPANKLSYPLIDKTYSQNKAFFPDEKSFERLHVLNNKISPKLLEEVWFLLKSA